MKKYRLEVYYPNGENEFVFSKLEDLFDFIRKMNRKKAGRDLEYTITNEKKNKYRYEIDVIEEGWE